MSDEAREAAEQAKGWVGSASESASEDSITDAAVEATIATAWALISIAESLQILSAPAPTATEG